MNIRNVDSEYQVLPSDESEKEKSQSLIDTAASINAVPRQSSQTDFIPIGHISLESKNKEAEHIDLDIPTEGVFWIKSFFIRHSVQGKGTGRAAMDEVEAMVVKEPLWAKTLMLSTVEGGDQVREEFAKARYGAVPKIKIVNQDWYSRRGYRGIKIVQNFFDVTDRNGKKWDTKAIFMRKDIS
ncbi:hypothetical protein N7448_004161 [Penicillium atrosanguineum]|uniref:uncharacterized protein n=1 Tax=Penicillium atrosanguineum TaxID=1132637 RepID=UPI0023971AA7|nr:uncharacterized protein N7443_003126 [Penicillium atrosanguineum]KAJ5140753.1 hypothetical protein N7448_004161 [Penicillium atrosanguineum]KAJ5310665.1 hypothetical protein N7443_003126 [Penicillium atrosanguineum]